jgi:SAM-dependent methyltransferase
MHMSDAMTTWGVGDYPLMAERLLPAAREVVDAASIVPADRVLDVATGTGNAALLAVECGGQVVGVDIEPVLLRVAEQRALQIGSAVRWLRGELDHLPVPDESNDVVLSVFGVMYANDHAAAARELERVTAPRGRIVLASWLPGSVVPAMGQVLSDYVPTPPAGSEPPSRWGSAEVVQTLLSDCGLRLITSSARSVTLTFPDAVTGADFLIATAGHVINQRQRLIGIGLWDELHRKLAAFVHERAVPQSDQIELPLEYLLAVAVKNDR